MNPPTPEPRALRRGVFCGRVDGKRASCYNSAHVFQGGNANGTKQGVGALHRRDDGRGPARGGGAAQLFTPPGALRAGHGGSLRLSLSLTYPCHVAMATGCWPMHTHIYNNERFLPQTRKRPWYFYTDEIARPTIFAAARKAGVSTGCVMWPCMGRGPIDTLVPEIWAKRRIPLSWNPFAARVARTLSAKSGQKSAIFRRGFASRCSICS